MPHVSRRARARGPAFGQDAVRRRRILSARRRALRGSILVTLLLAAIARAEPPETIDERLEGCEGLPGRDRVARYEPVGANALHAVARSGERYLVFPEEEGRACAVFPIGRAAARASGRFGGASKAFALQPTPCGDGTCRVALAIRGKGDRPLAALRMDEGCDAGVSLRPIALFPGRDSIELVCEHAGQPKNGRSTIGVPAYARRGVNRKPPTPIDEPASPHNTNGARINARRCRDA